MRWGVRDEAQIGHQGPELCYQEIVNCQKVSCGPSFIAIIGQRYGHRPALYRIPLSEMQILRDTLQVNTDKIK